MKKLWFILIIALAIIVFYYPNFFWPAINITPQVGTNDFTDGTYPMRSWSIDSLKKGVWPIWSGNISTGNPVLAGSFVFYPLKIIAYFLPINLSMNFTLFSSYFLLGLAAFFYFRELNFSKISSIFGTIALCFSGFSVHELMHLEAVISFSYLIWQLYFWEKYFKSHRFIFIIFNGLMFGLQILGGHFQFTFYGFLFLAIYLLFLKILKKESWLKLIIGGFVFIFLGLLIGSIQILPTIESTLTSTRSKGLSDEAIIRFNFPINNLKTFLFPYSDYSKEHTQEAFNHNGWPAEERYGYIGLIPLGLAFLAIATLFLTKPRIILFTLIGLFSLLLSFGSQTFLSFILLLPGFKFFRGPTHFLMLVDFCLICLATYGFSFIETKFRARLARLPASLMQRRSGPARQGATKNDLVKYLLIGIIVLSFLDVFYWGKKLYPSVSIKKWYQTPEVVTFLKNNLKNGERVTYEHYYYPSIRIFLNQKDLWNDPQIFINLRNLMPAFNGLMYDLPLAIGAANSGALKVARYNDLEMEMVFGGPKYSTDFKIAQFSPWYFPLNRLVGVRYFLFSSRVDSSNLKLVYQTNFKTGQDQIYVYETKDFLPRALIVDKRQVQKPEVIKEKLKDINFKPEEILLLEEKVNLRNGENLKIKEAVMTDYQDQKVEIKTKTDKESFLLLTDVYYPGWKAYLDNKETRIYQADYAFRAIVLPEGKHSLVFRYQPDSFVWGLRLTIVGFILTLILGLFSIVQRVN